MSNVAFHTSTCTNKECLTEVRVGRFLNRPSTFVGGFKFCPMCGSQAITGRDSDEDYWETLAKSYKLPVEIIKMLHESWNVHEHRKFYDHVQQMLKEAGLVKV